MTLTLRATVRRRRTFPDHRGLTWIATATARMPAHTRATETRAAYAASWPEAMQAAYKMLADLDHTLMAEVHESRAQRRNPIPAQDHHSLITTQEPTA